MRQYKAIIFDFDMTLADTSRVIYALLAKCVNEFGYTVKSFEDAYCVIGNTHEIMLSHISGETDPARLLEMRTRYRQLCRDEMAALSEFFPDAPACIANISGKGIKVGLLSLKLRDVLMQSLVKYDLAQYFQVVTGCDDVPAPKPDPSGLINTIKGLDVPAKDVLYVGDSLVDQDAAFSAGIDFAAMLRGSTTREQFDADRVKHFYFTADELWRDVASLD